MFPVRKPVARVADDGANAGGLSLRGEALFGRGFQRLRAGVAGSQRQRLGDLLHRQRRARTRLIGRLKMFRRRSEQLVDGSTERRSRRRRLPVS